MTWSAEERARMEALERKVDDAVGKITLTYAALTGVDQQGGILNDVRGLQRSVRTLEDDVNKVRGGVIAMRTLFAILGAGGVEVVRWIVTGHP